MIFYKEKFKAIRESLDLTQDDIARQLGITRQSVQDWEDGRCNPRRPKIYKISDIFQCKPEEFANFGPGEYREKTPETLPENKLLFYRKQARMTRRQLAKKIGVDEYTVEAWETYAQIYDQKYDPKIQEVLGLTDEQMCELDEESLKPGMAHQAALHDYRASLRGESPAEARAAVESFRDRVIKAIIPLDIDPAAKDKVLQTITRL